MYLLTATKTNLSALELSRSLGVAYSTAWRMKQKIMQAMAERGVPRRLNGFVQIDDAYLGGERTLPTLEWRQAGAGQLEETAA